jgi:tetrahydromethanopterin S-methyltransferase subunit B
VTALSGEFDIVGALTLSFPNGGETLYAKKKESINWRTLGSIEYVNLFYKTDTVPWTKLNDAPIENRNGDTEETTSYLLELPDLVSDTVQMRVQDANYSQVFDGTKPGPYDDSDAPFTIGYFSVQWQVGYFDDDTGEFRYMDNLSVTDSSGWSESGLKSYEGDDNSVPFLIEHSYPYGTYDTVWYRQFFNDTVDFRWVCDSNQTRRLVMNPSDTEPDAHVLADFTYDPGPNSLTIHTWIERGGRVLHNPDRASVRIYDVDGSVVRELGSSEVLADGYFRIVWNDVAVEEGAPPEAGKLQKGNTYLARVEVIFNGVSFTAAVTYTLSLAPEYEQISRLEQQIADFEHGITNQVKDLTDITTAFRDDSMLRLNTLTGQVDSIDVGVSNLVRTIGDFSNTVVNPLSVLTNGMVNVLMPSVTNIQAVVSNIQANTSADQARILNRPTTVELGSTNTILYKTMAGVEFGRVTVSVDGAGTEQPMAEVSPGLGIYTYDLVADWGLGSYTITCHDPNASDSMILQVVAAGGGTLADMANSIASMETNIVAMSKVMNQLDSLESVINDINNTVSSGGSTANMISQLENLITGSGGGADSSLIGSIANLTRQLDSIGKDSSDSRTYSKNARDYSMQALTILQKIQVEESAQNPEAVKSKLAELQDAVNKANSNIQEIPKTIGASSLRAQMARMAKQISDMAKREGLDYELGMAMGGEGTAAEGANEESITDLNQNINEMKISLKFMQKLLDEEANKPVIQEDWLGVE